MSYHYQVACNRCDYQSVFIWPLWACYQWSTGDTLEIGQLLAWCNVCDTVTEAEAITELGVMNRLKTFPPIMHAYDSTGKIWALDEIEAALDYARYPRFANLYDFLLSLKRWGAKQSVVLKNTLHLHWEWRLARTSSPRCLGCGQTNFITFDVQSDGEPKPDVHPGCGGILTVTKLQKARLRRCLWTIEGHRIGFG